MLLDAAGVERRPRRDRPSRQVRVRWTSCARVLRARARASRRLRHHASRPGCSTTSSTRTLVTVDEQRGTARTDIVGLPDRTAARLRPRPDRAPVEPEPTTTAAPRGHDDRATDHRGADHRTPTTRLRPRAADDRRPTPPTTAPPTTSAPRTQPTTVATTTTLAPDDGREARLDGDRRFRSSSADRLAERQPWEQVELAALGGVDDLTAGRPVDLVGEVVVDEHAVELRVLPRLAGAEVVGVEVVRVVASRDDQRPVRSASSGIR